MADLNDIELCKNSIITMADIIEKLNNRIILIEKNMLDIMEKNSSIVDKRKETNEIEEINNKPIIKDINIVNNKNIINEKNITIEKIEPIINKINEINEINDDTQNNKVDEIDDIKLIKKRIIRSRRRIN